MLCTESLRLIDKFKNLSQDGWTIIEIVTFVKACLCALVIFAASLEELKGIEKAEWVAKQFQELYWKINPDIPKIPNWIENTIEKIVIGCLTPALVKLAYNAVFKKDSEIENKILG